MDRMENLTSLFKKCKAIVRFLKFKGAEVAAKQDQLRELLENLPDEIFGGHDHDYGPPVNDPASAPPKTTLKSDNETRWNSKFIMLQSIYPNREVIRSLLIKHERSDLKFTSAELLLMCSLIEFLKTFKQATEVVEGFKHPTLSLVVPMWTRLLDISKPEAEVAPSEEDDLNNFNTEYVEQSATNAIMKELKVKVHEALSSRLSVRDPLLVLASSLDIRWKAAHFVFKTANEFVSAIDDFEQRIQVKPLSSSIIVAAEDSASVEIVKNTSKFVSLFGEYVKDLSDTPTQAPGTESKLTKEINSFLKCAPLSAAEFSESFDVLSWWANREAAFPMLSAVAKRLFSILASAASCESLFSTAGNIVTSIRSSLEPQNVDMLLFLFYNTPESQYDIQESEFF